MSKLSIETAIERINNKTQENNVTFLGFVGSEWKGVQTRLKLKCNKCGHEWEKCTYDNFVRGRGCPVCKRKGHFKNINSVLKIIQKQCDINNSIFIGFVGGEWKGVTTYLHLKCLDCGHEWETTRYCDFIKGVQCPKCTKINQMTPISDVISIIESRCNKYNLTFCGFVGGKYSGITTKLILRCNVCGFEWNTTTYIRFSNTGAFCKKCYRKSKMVQYDVALKNITMICQARNYTFIGIKNNEWIGNKTKLLLKCNKCGNTWDTTTYYSLNNGIGCPKCNQSKLESIIIQIFDASCIQYEYRAKPSFLQGLEVDFFLPERKIAIECQGLQHFEPVSFGEKDEDYKHIRFQKQIANDEKKRYLCKENHVTLLYFSKLGIEYPYEVIENEDIILKYIQNEQNIT